MLRKTTLVIIVSLLFVFEAGTQQKYALVIGNGNYTYWGSLNNPINDAADMKAALENLGFTVEYIADGNLDKMQTAVMNLKKKLSNSHNSYGLFYFAGHGVETNGQNYLIPANANIRSRNMLPQQALPVQFVLAELEDANNEFNVIILDACRNLPAELDRGGTRGLFTLTHQPSGSIVVYATEPGKTAEDGAGRNSPFTSQLLQHIRTPGLEVTEVFRRTGAGVMQATKNAQIPTLYSKFFGTAYLGTRPNNRDQEPVPPPISSLYDQLVNTTGTVTITVIQDTELPPETIISRATSITLRGDTSGRTVLGTGFIIDNVTYTNCIIIERGVTLILENITLKGVYIRVKQGGTLVMNNAATIIGCNTCGVDVGGIFTMNGGNIINNRLGGVDVGGTFTMNGGNIANNSVGAVMSGGGVHVFGTFTMNGGSIANNRAGDSGGGVFISGGTFTMKAGRIENNTAGGYGGGVYCSGAFYMHGGTIAGNRARKLGGGVHILPNNTFRMTGGTIYGSNGGSNANSAGSGLGGGHAVFDGNSFLFYAQNLTLSRYN